MWWSGRGSNGCGRTASARGDEGFRKVIDDFCILFSTLACVFVAYRAAQLDQILPWFGTPRQKPETREDAPALWTPPWG